MLGFSFASDLVCSMWEKRFRQPFMQIIVLVCLYVIANNWYSFTSICMCIDWNCLFFSFHPVSICGFTWPELPVIVFPFGFCTDSLSFCTNCLFRMNTIHAIFAYIFSVLTIYDHCMFRPVAQFNIHRWYLFFSLFLLIFHLKQLFFLFPMVCWCARFPLFSSGYLLMLLDNQRKANYKLPI